MTALPLLKRITRCIPGVQHTASLGDVLGILSRHPSTQAIVVLNGDTPLGIICRDLVADVVGLPCYSAWIDRQSCLQFISHRARVLGVDADVTEVARLLSSAANHHPADPVVMTADGAYLGIVERQVLMEALATQ
ncbi:CBS domain-containing protein [Cupriavidus pauculus]|uniref:CBS domain-containing protein n=1 Tax=Cupriavidus pauculus TaxID=82633 RepID=A0A2N5C5Q3_9BURK|nr:CBS domain-containing protein [Cupriavidus pauculus]PLP97510.1 hypothetical protein CYJ10_27165 [Cupriavidus pauculus]